MSSGHLLRIAALGAVAMPLVAAACASDGETQSGRTLHVPADHGSIQAAVDAAQPGDLVLVAPGTYHEEVYVDIPRIVIRGEDRNRVVLDGRHELVNGITGAADGIAVENLTTANFRQNGVLFNGVAAAGDIGDDDVYGTGDDVLRGFRASYVTAYNNGTYGIYAFASRDGVIEQSYASGHPDSGIYVGQCSPCNTVVRATTAERNAIGILFTNASGVQLVESTAVRNRLGVAVNSGYDEELAPSVGVEVVGNSVSDNDDAETPEVLRGFFSGGIAIGGSTHVRVSRNRVTAHEEGVGILVSPLEGFTPTDVRVDRNEVAHNALDLVHASDGTTDGNCFTANRFSSSLPDAIESALPCTQPVATVEPAELPVTPAPPGLDYRLVRLPPPQPQMPHPAATPASPPPPTVTMLDTDSIDAPVTESVNPSGGPVPSGPAGRGTTHSPSP